MKPPLSVFIVAAVLLAACEEVGQPPASSRAAAVAESAERCEVLQSAASLPPELEESSGVVVSRRDPGLLWSHNDSGWPAELYSITPAGELVSRVPVANAENVDWEDIAFGPCPSSGECLYIGDIGDNRAVREVVSVYRLPEPDPRGHEARADERFDMRYPGGPRDAEGLFVLPSGELFIVTKGGGESPAELYRYPGTLRAGQVAELELVARFSAGSLELLEQLTAADASPSGEWVGIRSYQLLSFHRTTALAAGDTAPAFRFPLDDVDEVQGEGFTLLDDGTVYLTGEAGFEGARGTVSILRCELP